MEKYEIEFFRLENGKEPAKDFLMTLESKMIAKMLRIIDLLEKNGPSLRMPYSEYLKDGIFEIRAKQGNDISRILYFFVVGQKIVLTNGFVKKTMKTPSREIEKAKKYKEEYERRMTR